MRDMKTNPTATGPVLPGETRDLRPLRRRRGAGSSLKALLAATLALSALSFGGLTFGSLTAAGANLASIPVPLTTWAPESTPSLVQDFIDDRSLWTVSPDGLSVDQVLNGQPVFYYSDFTAMNTQVVGKVSVSSTCLHPTPPFPMNALTQCGVDDDHIGFALGFNPGDAANANANFLLVDWKKRDQCFDYNTPPTPGSNSPRGLAASRVTGVPTADEYWGHGTQADMSTLVNVNSSTVRSTCANAPGQSSKIKELARGDTLGSTGWSFDVTYTVGFSFTAKALTVTVDGTDQINLSADALGMGDFNNGRLAFYGFSQDNIVYSAFTITPYYPAAVIVPEGSTVLLNEGSALAWSADMNNCIQRPAVVPATFDCGDGVFETGGSIIFSAAGKDGPSVYNFPIRVCNATDCAPGTAQVQVVNVAPVVASRGPARLFPGTTFVLNRPFTDAGTPDTHHTPPGGTADVNWDDGSPLQTNIPITGAFPGGGIVNAPHTFGLRPGDLGDPGSIYNIRVCVTDDDGATGCTVFPLLVTTVEGADAGGPYTVPEGSTVQLGASGSFDPQSALVTFAWDLDGNCGTDPANLLPGCAFETPGETATFSAVGLDGFPGSQKIVMVQGCRSQAECFRALAPVNITNVAPVVDAGPDRSIAPGNYLLSQGPATFTDAGLPDTHTATVSWGDGTATEGASVAQGAGSGNVNGTHNYPNVGVYFVTVCVTDDEGAADCDSLKLTVTNNTGNQVPIGAAGGPYTVPEGGSVPLTGSGTDPDGDPLTYAWDLDNNGTFETPGQNVTFSAAGRDGPSSQPVALRVCDPTPQCATATTTVNITNVPPAVTATGSTINEGGSASVAAAFTDPGVPDTHSALIQWGDSSSTPLPSVTSPFTATHVYGDNGTYTVTVTVTDDDAGSGVATTTVTVRNVAPSLRLDRSGVITFASGPAFTGRKTITQTHLATATDPGSDDETFAWSIVPTRTLSNTATIAWMSPPTRTVLNNGLTPDPAQSPTGTFPFTASHSLSVTFAAPGVYTVTAQVVDDDGGTDAGSLDRLPKLVTDNCDCTKSQGFWKHQLSLKGKHQIDDPTLRLYLGIIRFASGLFGPGDPITLDSLDDARRIMNPQHSPSTGSGSRPPGSGNTGRGGSNRGGTRRGGNTSPGGQNQHGSTSGGTPQDRRARALAQTLAAWLNFAKGGILWDEMVDTNRDGTPDLRFRDLIAQVETILKNPNATAAELDRAKSLAEAVNLHDKNNPACQTGTGTQPPGGTGSGTGSQTGTGSRTGTDSDTGTGPGPHPSAIGRMTGGGSLLGPNRLRVTHGFELRCSGGPNNLEVNWNGNKFHLERLTTIACSDDPAIRPNPPGAAFDTITGSGVGRLNNRPGATIQFTFKDAGEPGTSDTATITIKDAAGNTVLTTTGRLTNGNHQAHQR